MAGLKVGTCTPRIAVGRGPGRERLDPVVGGDGCDELGEEDARPLDRAHQAKASGCLAAWSGAGGRAALR